MGYLERIDKFLASQTSYSRKDVRNIIKMQIVKVNDVIVNRSDFKVNPDVDKIMINDKLINYQKYVYLILNKPKGYVSATADKKDKIVLDLVPEKYQKRNLFPVGRLDKNTTGLMIITDDGAFAHNVLSPKKHVPKKYFVTIDCKITEEMIKGFLNGIMLDDGICKSAVLEKTSENCGIVTLYEGRYHQIKRMFMTFHAKVVELERIQMGNLSLPKDLSCGMIRELTAIELNKIEC